MTREDMVHRLSRLQQKLYSNCYGLYDSLNRYGDMFNWMKKCQAYERACDVLAKRLGF